MTREESDANLLAGQAVALAEALRAGRVSNSYAVGKADSLHLDCMLTIELADRQRIPVAEPVRLLVQAVKHAARADEPVRQKWLRVVDGLAELTRDCSRQMITPVAAASASAAR